MVRETSPGNFVPMSPSSDSKDCALEGVGNRPKDCPNNPLKSPENHRPRICEECPSNGEIWELANHRLPANYIKLKQAASKSIHPWQIEQAKRDTLRNEHNEKGIDG